MNKNKAMYLFMFCFTVGSILFVFVGIGFYKDVTRVYYEENRVRRDNSDFCACENEELQSHLCPDVFAPLSGFAVANYFYFMGVIFLMLYRDIPSPTEVFLLLKSKYQQRKK